MDIAAALFLVSLFFVAVMVMLTGSRKRKPPADPKLGEVIKKARDENFAAMQKKYGHYQGPSPWKTTTIKKTVRVAPPPPPKKPIDQGELDDLKRMLDELAANQDEEATPVPVADDECPECGKLFVMEDDYICPDCRKQLS